MAAIFRFFIHFHSTTIPAITHIRSSIHRSNLKIKLHLIQFRAPQPDDRVIVLSISLLATNRNETTTGMQPPQDRRHLRRPNERKPVPRRAIQNVRLTKWVTSKRKGAIDGQWARSGSIAIIRHYTDRHTKTKIPIHSPTMTNRRDL